ncbi:hypothetical protein T265_07507 [Opisthorchis viverrini]|uniref:Uncharacterized protein n=1 Tax=Opisthorchis viverrini TaxID=6198 RepID=A0A074ZNN5_OPIVI|nr:hypothetical protein T265_07507 [Opisthorchis viverrini]KER24945.1 hypothetical protein T265_07507 [Opisthorchis viverrini]
MQTTNGEKGKKLSVLDNTNSQRATISEKIASGKSLSGLRDTKTVISPLAEHSNTKASRRLGKRERKSKKKLSTEPDLEPENGPLSNVGMQSGLKRGEKKKPHKRKQSENIARHSGKSVTETGQQTGGKCRCDSRSDSCRNIVGECKDKIKSKSSSERTRKSRRQRKSPAYEWVNCPKIFDVILLSVPQPDKKELDKEGCLTKCADHSNIRLDSDRHFRRFANKCYHCCTSEEGLALLRSRPTNPETVANAKAGQATTPTGLGAAEEGKQEWTDNEYDICLKRCAALSNECHRYHGEQALPQVCRDNALGCEKSCNPSEN